MCLATSQLHEQEELTVRTGLGSRKGALAGEVWALLRQVGCHIVAEPAVVAVDATGLRVAGAELPCTPLLCQLLQRRDLVVSNGSVNTIGGLF